MRRTQLIIVVLSVTIVLATIGALWSRDPMDQLKAYRVSGSAVSLGTFFEGGFSSKQMERHAVLKGITQDVVGKVLQDYYSPAKGWTWKVVKPNLFEAKDSKGNYVCYGASRSEVHVTERVTWNWKQVWWRRLAHRNSSY